ncbi:MAG: protein-L-isoaspartate(D-aspartate) O-methyltransferase [Paludibacteraceae bacterium]|nr:protein-L-isoaspartate(D-aspartate) O-methyltransferase [Paludibacteraceae bacterium]
MTDTPRHAALRRRLAEELQKKGIKDEKVLDAIRNVPRHLFMSSSFEPFAYNDSAYPIGANQTISQPHTVALQTELLNPQPKERILEIGTGSGYQTAVLVHCGATVYTIERIRELHLQAQATLNNLKYKAICKYGDGHDGWNDIAPFDRIIVTAGAEEMPMKLIKQCKIGGVIVVPVLDNGTLKMLRLTRQSEEDFTQEDFGPCAFVPMLKGIS